MLLTCITPTHKRRWKYQGRHAEGAWGTERWILKLFSTYVPHPKRQARGQIASSQAINRWKIKIMCRRRLSTAMKMVARAKNHALRRLSQHIHMIAFRPPSHSSSPPKPLQALFDGVGTGRRTQARALPGTGSLSGYLRVCFLHTVLCDFEQPSTLRSAPRRRSPTPQPFSSLLPYPTL